MKSSLKESLIRLRLAAPYRESENDMYATQTINKVHEKLKKLYSPLSILRFALKYSLITCLMVNSNSLKNDNDETHDGTPTHQPLVMC